MVWYKNSITQWLDENREMAVEALRIYLGLGLMLKGVQFIANQEQAAEYMSMISLPFFEFFSAHLIVLTHLAGGLFLTLGLLTRVAALVQVPMLLGAIFFVHMQQGLFTKAQNLEFVILVLFLLLFFVVYGGGKFSIDYVLKRRQSGGV
jgi:putative oxidoreductase